MTNVTLNNFSGFNDSDLEPGNDTNDIHSVENKKDNLMIEWHQNQIQIFYADSNWSSILKPTFLT